MKICPITKRSLSYSYNDLKCRCKSCKTQDSNRRTSYYKRNQVKENSKDKEYLKLNPWIKTLKAINKRCNNPKVFGYKYYGLRGIKNYLTAKELKYLWNRDEASKLRYPSIERLDVNGCYTLTNCKYIEMSEQSKNRRGTKLN